MLVLQLVFVATEALGAKEPGLVAAVLAVLDAVTRPGRGNALD